MALSNAQKARRRNTKTANKLPLFAHAGIIEQVAKVWDSQTVMDDTFARAMARDVSRQVYLKRSKCQLEIYERLAESWGVCPMPTYHRTVEYILDSFNTAIAAASGMTPLEVFELAGGGE